MGAEIRNCVKIEVVQSIAARPIASLTSARSKMLVPVHRLAQTQRQNMVIDSPSADLP